MTYDVYIGDEIHKGLTYAELISLPLNTETYVRRENSNWIHAKDCVELSHIIANYPTLCQDGPADIQTAIGQHETAIGQHDSYEDSLNEDIEEEHVFIPTEEYFKCKQKRKTAAVGVLTLGLAGLALMGVGNTWRSNIFEGLSFTKNDGMGFVFKCLSFLLLTTLIAIPYFIYSAFSLIYYSIRINSLKR
ncbi:MAG: hypothetical protein NC102_02630 [Clostridium sp.]|nr:hypothetical protein [Clostridium sp.]